MKGDNETRKPDDDRCWMCHQVRSIVGAEDDKDRFVLVCLTCDAIPALPGVR